MLKYEIIAAADPSSPFLMVVLHGLGDSMEGYRWLPEQLRLPWLGYALVNAPDPYGGGFSWYDIEGDSGRGIERSRRLLLEFLDHLEAEGYRLPFIFMFGFSQGCLMVLEVGLRIERVLAGWIGVSGYVYQPDRLLSQRPGAASKQHFLVTHGTQDPLIPISPVRDTLQRFQAAGLDIQWREFPKAHTIQGEEEIALIRKFLVERRRSKETGTG